MVGCGVYKWFIHFVSGTMARVIIGASDPSVHVNVLHGTAVHTYERMPLVYRGSMCSSRDEPRSP